jgi:hypothetical protein
MKDAKRKKIRYQNKSARSNENRDFFYIVNGEWSNGEKEKCEKIGQEERKGVELYFNVH